MATQLQVIANLIKSGKIRSFGLSNETPYGIAMFTALADSMGLPRPCTTQNAYSLLVRNDVEGNLLEACSPINSNVGLIAHSPLAGGALTGKYLDHKKVHFVIKITSFLLI